MDIVSHRGCRKDAFENTLPAFERANKETKILEFDVQLTKDGVAVICHDDDLIRVCGVPTRISQTPYKDLPVLKNGQHIPTFDELLNACPQLFLHVEIKNPRAWPVIKNKLPQKRCLVSSFHFSLVQEAADEVNTLWLVEGKAPTKWRQQTKASYLGLERKHLYNPFVNPTDVYLYTINNPVEVAFAKTRGFAGIYCDYAERFTKNVLSKL